MPSIPDKQHPLQHQAKRRPAAQVDAAGAPLRQWVRFKHLVTAGVVSNWTQLLRLIELENFPAGKMLSPNVRAWLADEVESWLENRPPPGDRREEPQTSERHAEDARPGRVAGDKIASSP